MRILHRYVLTELIRVFLLGLTAFTAIFVVVGLIQEATQQGLNPLQILSLVPFVIPASLPYTIPATLLLAVTMVYGRLAADNEITATKAAGISVIYLLVPALVLGIGLSVLTLLMHDRIIPVANLRMRTVLVNNVEDMVYAVLKKDHVLKANGSPFEIHCERVEGKKLFNTTFKRRTPEGTYDMIAFAQEAALEFDLKNRSVRVHMFKAEVTDGQRTRIEIGQDKEFEIGLPSLNSVSPGIRDMTNREIEERKVEVVRLHERECGLWAFGSLSPIAGGRMAQVQWGSLVGLASRGRDAQRELWRLDLEPHMRRAISFGCLAFVLLGFPVAILFQRGDYLSAFISCFLPIIVVYYPVVMFGFNLSKEGITHPIVLWGGNLVLVLLAGLVYRPVLRH